MQDRYLQPVNIQLSQLDSSIDSLHIPNLALGSQKFSFPENHKTKQSFSPLRRLIPNLKSEKILLKEYSGDKVELQENGDYKIWHWWYDETGRHRETYYLTPEGDIKGYHYGQRGRGSQIIYDYHNEKWRKKEFDEDPNDPSNLCDCDTYK